MNFKCPYCKKEFVIPEDENIHTVCCPFCCRKFNKEEGIIYDRK